MFCIGVRLLGSWGHPRCPVKRGWSVVCFKVSMFVEHNTCKNTKRHGSPFNVRVVTARWNQVTVSLWTASRTPSLTSLSIDALTCCYQRKATAIAFVSGSTWSFNSRPSIRRSVWFSQVLQVLDRYLSSIQFWKAARLASLDRSDKAVDNGSDLGLMGLEQSHPSSGRPAAAERTDRCCRVAYPIWGKSLGKISSAVQASRLQFAPSITSVIKQTWAVCSTLPEPNFLGSRRITVPRFGMTTLFTANVFGFTGMMSEFLKTTLWMILISTRTY